MNPAPVHSPTPPLSVVAAARALAWSEAFLNAGVRQPTLALWTTPPDAPAVAIGLSQNLEREVDAAACRRDGVAVVRRASGGGAVWLGPGVLCWEAFRPAPADGSEALDLRGDYLRLSRPVADACAKLGATVARAGISDLAAALPDAPASGTLRKIAGMAQLRRRGGVLVHGSLLVSGDLAPLSRYLRMPSAMPDYRAGRGHDDFCVTLSDAAGRPLTLADVARTVAEILSASGWSPAIIPAELPDAAQSLWNGKYLCESWTIKGTQR